MQMEKQQVRRHHRHCCHHRHCRLRYLPAYRRYTQL
jgi:hypothetical protein